MSKNEGFVLTQTMVLVLTVLSLVLGSSSYTAEQKDELKAQLLPIIQSEINLQSSAASAPNDMEPGPALPVEIEEIDRTKVKEYYSQVTFKDHGKGPQTFPNNVSYTVTNNGYNEFMGNGLYILIAGRWDFPVNWLIEKNYIPNPDDLKDLFRLKKVFGCEYRAYLYKLGKWAEYPQEKDQCEYFLKLTPDEQWQYDKDIFEETGNHYFQ